MEHSMERATNTTFNNNIFGISRDDVEMLEQKVSKSVNAGTILTVATIITFAEGKTYCYCYSR
ncbi:hypothetical protein [Chryseobacterium lathyri]|uniref:hypothetical protein n=1 Tax=Chryseobacterium lathyri TaxID=395933 RepID=UPI0027813078|nr:hypothetical protein [Chryseobacterium lathyri]MDQ0064194.1 hypothetical protein [Chryseobacterium lathyri]